MLATLKRRASALVSKSPSTPSTPPPPLPTQTRSTPAISFADPPRKSFSSHHHSDNDDNDQERLPDLYIHPPPSPALSSSASSFNTEEPNSPRTPSSPVFSISHPYQYQEDTSIDSLKLKQHAPVSVISAALEHHSLEPFAKGRVQALSVRHAKSDLTLTGKPLPFILRRVPSQPPLPPPSCPLPSPPHTKSVFDANTSTLSVDSNSTWSLTSSTDVPPPVLSVGRQVLRPLSLGPELSEKAKGEEWTLTLGVPFPASSSSSSPVSPTSFGAVGKHPRRRQRTHTHIGTTSSTWGVTKTKDEPKTKMGAGADEDWTLSLPLALPSRRTRNPSSSVASARQPRISLPTLKTTRSTSGTRSTPSSPSRVSSIPVPSPPKLARALLPFGRSPSIKHTTAPYYVHVPTGAAGAQRKPSVLARIGGRSVSASGALRAPPIVVVSSPRVEYEPPSTASSDSSVSSTRTVVPKRRVVDVSSVSFPGGVVGSDGESVYYSARESFGSSMG